MHKILHIIPTLEGGGAEHQLVLLSNYLSTKGYEVHIALRKGGINKNNLNKNIVIHQLGNYKALHPKLIWSLHKLVRLIEPDIIQTWLLQMDIVGGIIAILNKIPWIMTERSSKVGHSNYFIPSRLRLLLAKWSKCIVANSIQGANYWKRKSKTQKPIRYIPNIVAISSITSAKKLVPPLGDSKKPLFISVGRLIDSKGFDILINALTLIPNNESINVLIIGEGPEKYNLERLIKICNLESLVFIIPYQEKWWGYLKHARALISMSQFEGMPNVILEGMAGKCPLIVSDIQEHRDLLGESAALYVQLNNSQMLADSIEYILKNRKNSKDRVDAALSLVSEFNEDTIGKSYESIYNQII